MKDDQSHLKHALNRSNFSHSKNRVSRDCQSSIVTLAYSYIKLQVCVIIEYNTWIATAITVLVTHHQHALKDLTIQTARIELVETASAAQ